LKTWTKRAKKINTALKKALMMMKKVALTKELRTKSENIICKVKY